MPQIAARQMYQPTDYTDIIVWLLQRQVPTILGNAPFMIGLPKFEQFPFALSFLISHH